jgi:hypothetical protein
MTGHIKAEVWILPNSRDVIQEPASIYKEYIRKCDNQNTEIQSSFLSISFTFSIRVLQVIYIVGYRSVQVEALRWADHPSKESYRPSLIKKLIKSALCSEAGARSQKADPLLGKYLETNNETIAVAMQWRVKHASTTMALMMETAFSARSVHRSYLEDKRGRPSQLSGVSWVLHGRLWR